MASFERRRGQVAEEHGSNDARIKHALAKTPRNRVMQKEKRKKERRNSLQDPLQDTTRRDQVVMKSRRKHEGENRKRGGGERGRPGWWLTLRHRVTLTPSLLPRQLLHGIARYQRRNVFQLLQRAFEYRTGVRQSFVCVSHTHTYSYIRAQGYGGLGSQMGGKLFRDDEDIIFNNDVDSHCFRRNVFFLVERIV